MVSLRIVLLVCVVFGPALACGQLGFDGPPADAAAEDTNQDVSADGGNGGDSSSPVDAASDAAVGDSNPRVDAANDVRDDAVVALANQAFVSSEQYDGNIGGVAAADTHCARLAVGAGLVGNFVALLTDSVQDAVERAELSRGWVDVSGQPIVDLASGWRDGRMLYPLQRDERGMLVAGGVWLGGASTCADWTSTDGTGIVARNTRVLRPFTFQSCTERASLVCVEIGQTAEVRPPPTPGRLAFVSAPWAPAGGIASADGVCASEAAANALPGTFRALLATSTQAPFDRFSLIGTPWMRTDGIPLVVRAVDLAGPTPAFFESFLTLGADGNPPDFGFSSWRGTESANCADWTSAAETELGTQAEQDSVDRIAWEGGPPRPCDRSRRLICLEE